MMVFVQQEQIKRKLSYRGQLMVTCTIGYPVFQSTSGGRVLSRINRFYRRKAIAFFHECKADLLPAAVRQYENDLNRGYAFSPYEGMLLTAITYNDTGTLSLYSDHYTFTGGAHGNTIRNSDTWDLEKGRRLLLGDIFPGGRKTLLHLIESRIAWQLKSNQMRYFDDYQQSVDKTFNPDQFFLTQEGLILYFQQYDISPYASGIPEFVFPYGQGGLLEPACSSSFFG